MEKALRVGRIAAAELSGGAETVLARIVVASYFTLA
jgi:hypothetical protein